MKYFIVLLFALSIISCKKDASKTLRQGSWLGQLEVGNSELLPFNFEVTSSQTLKISNADEVIVVDDIMYRNDSVFIKVPVFEGYFAAKLTEEGMVGRFINRTMEVDIAFKALYNTDQRFHTDKEAYATITGAWEVLFVPKSDSDSDAFVAKGIFEQNGNQVTGTFRTKTGDYRYLEGVVNGEELRLSTFDGAHAYLFVAKVTDSTLNGIFYSGNDYEASFTAKKNPSFELPAAETLTSLQDDYDEIEFSFPNEKGAMVSLKDEKFKNKVVIVQLMGTWCPNCLDESTYYSEYSKNNADNGVEFIALAFENAKTEPLAFEAIKRLKQRIGITYPVLLAQHGSSDKLEAHKKLPMLSEVVSYPTTVFIDKTGKVRKIHTGFNGPATGKNYTDFKIEFNRFINLLLAE